MPRIELERIEEVEDPSQRSSETFDRIAFAQRAVSLAKPAGTTVVICPGSRRVHVQAGRQWGGAPGQRWALLTVSANASRRAIANAVLELGATARPWALDLLIDGCGTAHRGPGQKPPSSTP